MTIEEVRALVAKGENTCIEFKRRINDPERVAKELVAFANTEGGHLFVGVNDEGYISGLKDVEENRYVLHNIIDHLCLPPLKYTEKVVPINEKKSVLVYSVEPSKKLPVRLMEDDRLLQGKVYYRIADRSIQASKELRQILKLREKEQDHVLSFGPKEKLLMNYLGEHEFVTISIFCEIAKIPKFIASKILVKMVLINVLRIIPEEGKEDHYVEMV